MEDDTQSYQGHIRWQRKTRDKRRRSIVEPYKEKVDFGYVGRTKEYTAKVERYGWIRV